MVKAYPDFTAVFLLLPRLSLLIPNSRISCRNGCLKCKIFEILHNMKIHPLLQDPDAVFVMFHPPPEPVSWESFRQAAHRAFSMMQVEIEGERVIIKPNVTSGEHFANPDSGVTTHPGFILGMIDYFLEHGGRINRMTIAEDPRDTDDNHPRHWKGTGYDRINRETGVKLHCPTTYTCVKKNVPQPLVYKRLNVSRLALTPNTVLFNVPKLKTHNLSITTLGMKNLMGLVNVFDRHYCLEAWLEMPPEVLAERRPRHEWFDQNLHELWQTGLARRLVDTAKVIRPALNIIEGVVGREGTGFQRGRNRALGLVVAGINVATVDSITSYLMGFEPDNIVYLRLAKQAGLGTVDIEKLRIYTEHDGKLELCNDVQTLRISPPIQVVKNIVGEDAALFRETASVDASDNLFGKSKA
jgi:uncharacterized protein (DUF362 family)